jgi:hypothetical protein
MRITVHYVPFQCSTKGQSKMAEGRGSIRLAHTSVWSPEMAVAFHRRSLSPQIQDQRSPNGGAFACLVVPATTEI